jgi:ribosomal protein S18 acetylase RimI-like enzyme
VLPGHRGRGVGGLLVEEFLGWARERGAPYAVVSSFSANGSAQSLYERHGFGEHTVTLRRAL